MQHAVAYRLGKTKRNARPADEAIVERLTGHGSRGGWRLGSRRRRLLGSWLLGFHGRRFRFALFGCRILRGGLIALGFLRRRRILGLRLCWLTGWLILQHKCQGIAWIGRHQLRSQTTLPR